MGLHFSRWIWQSLRFLEGQSGLEGLCEVHDDALLGLQTDSVNAKSFCKQLEEAVAVT